MAKAPISACEQKKADARRESTRDGDALCDLLKDRGLGVTVRMVEEVTVNDAAFADF